MKKSCYHCGSRNVKKFGKTKQSKQRFRCLNCLKTYIWHRRRQKASNEQIWFHWWVKEGLSLRQISRISKHGRKKLKRIKAEWLNQDTPALYKDYSKVKYLIFDGTYFTRKNTLLLFMNEADGKAISCCYVDSEDYENTYKMASELKRFGVRPKSVTLDGLKCVIAAVKDVWPEIIIQRCLYHIEHQGTMWLRSHPKTQAGRDLKEIFAGVTRISDNQGKELFTQRFNEFLGKHKEYIRSLSYKEVGYKDLKKAVTLIINANADMWHYLEDAKIPKTTNKLEGYFSQLKKDYGNHRGLAKHNRDSYLKWYCYYKNHTN
jgi:transposase-like protein